MNKDVQRLREPGAWVLLGSVAIQILSGLIGLVAGRGNVPFTYQAFVYVNADQFFTGVTVTGVVVVAVLLATRLGGPPTRQARNIALGALIVLGVVALLTVICMLAGLGAGDVSSGVVLDSATTAKFVMFLYGISKLAVLAVGGYYVLHVYQSLAPATPYGPQYPQQGWGQPGMQPPYGQPGAQAPYGQQPPVYGQQPPQQPYPQQGYVPAPYGSTGPYGQPGQPGQPAQHGQPGQPQPGGRPPAPPMPPQPPSGPPSGPQPAAQSSGPQPVVPSSPQSDEVEGEWTRAYGGGEAAKGEEAEDDRPESPSSDRSPAPDPYRPPE